MFCFLIFLFVLLICYLLITDFFGFGDIPTSPPAISTQDSAIGETCPMDETSAIDLTTGLIDTEMPAVPAPSQDKSCGQSQFTDSGFGDDATMSLTQNESSLSQQRPSDILIASECVPDNLTINTDQSAEVNIAQQARSLKRQTENEEMKNRVSTACVSIF